MALLEGSLIPKFKIRRSILVFSKQITKKDSIVVVNLFRENYPISYTRCKTLETHWDDTQSIRHTVVSGNDESKHPELIFNRLQVSDEEYIDMHKRSFGRYIAREAVLNEEYWMAAWLRAEAHWEASAYKRFRHAEIFKMKFADQEFKALKKRCSGQEGNSLQSFCLVAVKKEVKNIKRTVLNSIVGTMDLSIRQYLQGETYPGLKKQCYVLASKQPYDAHKYAYISNVVVAKYARRCGIASNMLCLGTHIATAVGMKKLFVHVDTDNEPARELYRKVGFQFVTTDDTSNNRLLMWMKL
ncbi:GCN5-related N-acetyltransferase 6, chloroplastic-like isoform X2 [Rutidosis leptorrhynchoides]|uniref:GCN5-related N-acetyltransferase 6, chloroplastic-like isoform X2 n=1 Tax=Rutidosis leptorrhynchoides TaxID=125765 RepID=UPI003A98E056